MSENVRVADGFLVAAIAIAGGQSAPEVAKLVGVSERTIRRWCGRDSFASLVSRLRTEMLGAALGQLVSATGSAVGALTGLLSSPDEKTRLSAASKILSHVLAVRDAVEVAQRVEELTERLREIEKQQTGNGGGRASN